MIKVWSPIHVATLIALSALGIVAAGNASAQRGNPFQQSQSAWKRMDDCKRQAWKAHPEYTAATSKRDQAVKQCLASQNLPPVAPQSPATRDVTDR